MMSINLKKNKNLILIISSVCLLSHCSLLNFNKENIEESPAFQELKISTQVQKKDILYLKMQLDSVTKVIEDITDQIDSLNNKGELTIPNNNSAANETIGQLVKVTSSQNEKIKDLQSQISLIDRKINYADSINFEVLSQLVILENRILSLSDGIKEYRKMDNNSSTRQSNIPGESYRERYLQALTLYQNYQYNEAIVLFRQLLKENTKHELADNAQYWIGECLYSLKKYEESIREFEKIFNFINTNKDDDAQFKIGLCYLGLGYLEKGRQELQKLIDYYPRSEYVEKVNQIMR